MQYAIADLYARDCFRTPLDTRIVEWPPDDGRDWVLRHGPVETPEELRPVLLAAAQRRNPRRGGRP